MLLVILYSLRVELKITVMKKIINNMKAQEIMKAAEMYNRMKAAARSAAIEWKAASNDAAVSYSELAEIGGRFYTLGKRYGLLMEFRENGIPC